VKVTHAILLIPLLAGCRHDANESPKSSAPAIHVETVQVREQPMPATLNITGTLKGERQTVLAANTTGRVVSTPVERGGYVKKGDVLARIDVTSAALAAAEANANLELSRAQRDAAKRECERYAKLRERGAVSQLEYDRQVDQCLTSALSAHTVGVRAQTASKAVSDGVIRAPFAGFIAERHIEEGQYVRPDSPVVTLVQVDPLRLEFTVAEANVAQVEPSASVTFTVPAFPDKTYSGTVRYVGAAVREGTRDLVAEAVVANLDKSLKPGMFATVALGVPDKVTASIPKSALRIRDGKSYVFAIVDNRVEERVVLTGMERGDDIAVTRGLRAQDKIVSKPADTITNGQYVD
jgi:membrane fusion protein, multidrug efflux system